MLRPSGTEPLIRVMVEALDEARLDAAMQRLVSRAENRRPIGVFCIAQTLAVFSKLQFYALTSGFQADYFLRGSSSPQRKAKSLTRFTMTPTRKPVCPHFSSGPTKSIHSGLLPN